MNTNNIMKKMITISIGLLLCFSHHSVGQNIPNQNEIISKIHLGYIPLLVKGVYHNGENRGAFLEVKMLNGLSRGNLQLKLYGDFPALHEQDEVCGIVYGKDVSRDVLREAESSNFLSLFVYAQDTSEEQWKECLYLYYEYQILLELQKLVSLMNFMDSPHMKEDLSRNFMLSFLNYLKLVEVKSTLSIVDLRHYHLAHSELRERIGFWEDLFLEKYLKFKHDPLWNKIEAGKIHID